MGRKKRKTVVETAAPSNGEDGGDDNNDNDNDNDPLFDNDGEDGGVMTTSGPAASTVPTTATAGRSASDPRSRRPRVKTETDGGMGEGSRVDGGADEATTTGAAAVASSSSSGYAMTTHSAEIIDDDIYVSDGSESDEDALQDAPDAVGGGDGGDGESAVAVVDERNPNRAIEMVLSGSRMGLMRRGVHLHPTMLVQPNRQWTRQTTPAAALGAAAGAADGGGDGITAAAGDGQDAADQAAALALAAEEEERRKREQEELELAKLDPAQRAARLLAEKQRKLEEAKIMARKMESEENAGRDPCLFSKRTSFDIRFDQIDDKPWVRGGDMTDFFNYGFLEEDWLEYAEQQLMIRQELIDSNRQKRQPDPSVVPVVPKRPKKQTPKVAVSSLSDDVDAGGGGVSGDAAGAAEMDVDDDDDDENAPVAGPVLVKKEDNSQTTAKDQEMKDAKEEEEQRATQGPASKDVTQDFVDIKVGSGGAWGAGAAPGSMLARLIEEQDRQEERRQQAAGSNIVAPSSGIGAQHHHDDASVASSSHYGHTGGGAAGGPGSRGAGGGSVGGFSQDQPQSHRSEHYQNQQESSRPRGWNSHAPTQNWQGGAGAGDWDSQGFDGGGHQPKWNASNNNHYQAQGGGSSERGQPLGHQQWQERGQPGWKQPQGRGGDHREEFPSHHGQQQQQQSWGQRDSSYGGGGGRGGIQDGGRGGRFGRGDFGGRGRGGGGRGDRAGGRGDVQTRKRPREEKDDRYRR